MAHFRNWIEQNSDMLALKKMQYTLYVLNVARIKSRESREKIFATFIEKVARTKCREQWIL